MKAFGILIIILITGINPLKSQTNFNSHGKWLGTLIVNESTELRIGIEVSENESKETVSVMHSLDQGAFDIPIDSTVINADSIFFNIALMGARFNGVFADSMHINGHFDMGNRHSFILNLKRVSEFPVKKPKRPQEPHKPYPYSEELVYVPNDKAKEVTLAGTLTIPKGEGRFPAVILISGSGPNHRNANIFGHKVFLVLADYLTRNGIAVLRTDDRGTHQSTGDYNSADILALGSDVAALFQFLQNHDKIDADRIGVLGHSHGASIAPVAAAIEADIAFAILMAGAAESLAENMIEQTKIIYKQNGASYAAIALNTKFLNAAFNIVKQDIAIEDAKKQFEVFIRDFEKELISVSEEDLKIIELTPPLNTNIIKEFMTPAMKKDLFYQPADHLIRMKCPTLILNGNKDVQVPVRHLCLTQKIVMSNGNTRVTAKVFNNKNHLFQSSETGAVSEYKEIEETISPEVLSYIAKWILDLDKGRVY